MREIRTTFYPTTYFAERLVAGAIPVVNPVPKDADPIFWSPPRDVIADYQRAGAIVLNGARFEQWALRTTLPAARTINTAEGFRDRFLTFESETTHSHGPTGEHTHAGIDGHTWLDPLLAIEQVRALAAGLERLFPELETTAERLALEADLLALDERLRTELVGLGNVRLFASHPAYDYLARRYAWEVTNLDLDPESAPPAGTIEALADPEGRGLPIVLLWESPPTGAAAGPFAAVGVRNVVFSPLESAPSEGDYLEAMNANIDRLCAAVVD
ncbi:MAG: metal ABC transporter substrate-binding protein [Planctomycetota bacterium]